MHLTSIDFIVFFAVLLVVYYAVPLRVQRYVLLLANLVFYWFGGPGNLIFIVFTTLVTYLLALRVGRLRGQEDAAVSAAADAGQRKEELHALKRPLRRRRRLLLLLCLVFNIGVLCAVKILATTGDLARMLGGADSAVFGLALPLGISFYTFQSIGYAIDVSRGVCAPERSLVRFSLFVSFFPQLVQGPISRFSKLSPSLFAPHRPEADNLQAGALRMCGGFFKKLVVADRLMPAVVAMGAARELHSGIYFLVHAFLYLVTLYADFSGGIDIALGAARMLGIALPENFDRPFFTKNLAEFWRHWHMTLGNWFRDYVYYPLTLSSAMIGLSRRAQKVFKGRFGKMLHMHVATLLLWLLIGLWHGFTLNFILWGLVNAVFVIVSLCLEPLYKKVVPAAVKASAVYGIFEILRTVALRTVITALDCYRDAGEYFRGLGSLFTGAGAAEGSFAEVMLGLGLTGLDYAVAAAGLLVMLGISLCGRSGTISAWLRRKPAAFSWAALGAAVMVILVFGAYGFGFESSQFIYNQF